MLCVGNGVRRDCSRWGCVLVWREAAVCGVVGVQRSGWGCVLITVHSMCRSGVREAAVKWVGLCSDHCSFYV